MLIVALAEPRQRRSGKIRLAAELSWFVLWLQRMNMSNKLKYLKQYPNCKAETKPKTKISKHKIPPILLANPLLLSDNINILTVL